jgi:hypothetical protein
MKERNGLDCTGGSDALQEERVGEVVAGSSG